MATVMKNQDPGDAKQKDHFTVRIPWTTFTSAAAVILCGAAAVTIWPLLKIVFLAAVIATALYPLVHQLQANRFLDRWAKATVIFFFIAIISILFALLIPQFIDQFATLVQRYPTLRDGVLKKLPEGNAFRSYLQHISDTSAGAQLGRWYEQINWAGSRILSALAEFGLFVVITCYFIIDGRKLYDWFTAFFPPRTQRKIHQTAEGSSELVVAYVFGQLITSSYVFCFSLVTLLLFHIPAAVVLALTAAVLDCFPVVGFLLTAGITIVLSLSVSLVTGVGVAVCYLAYHLLENYVIIPRVYGKKLRLSSFTVLMAILIGWELGGLIGALLSLPLASSYSVIEKVWLSGYLHPRVIEEHEELKNEEFGPETRKDTFSGVAG